MDAEWSRRERFKSTMKAEIMGQHMRWYAQAGIKTCNSLVCLKKTLRKSFTVVSLLAV